MANDLFVLVPYFNPYKFKTRRRNLEVCIESLKSAGSDFAVAEILFPGQSSVMPSAKNCITFYSKSVLWQKERVINAALVNIDKKYSKIAWIDSDIVFLDKSWIRDSSDLLNNMQVAQLFSSVLEFTNKANAGLTPLKPRLSSIASLLKTGNLHDSAWGYAWAARRDFLEAVGLYDPLIVGGGSLAWMYALILKRGSRFLWAKAALENKLFSSMNKTLCNNYMLWAEKVSGLVGDQIGVTNHKIKALWHDDAYPLDARTKIYSHFDIERSIYVDTQGCWSWKDDNQDLAGQVKEMFLRREEDG